MLIIDSMIDRFANNRELLAKFIIGLLSFAIIASESIFFPTTILANRKFNGFYSFVQLL